MKILYLLGFVAFACSFDDAQSELSCVGRCGIDDGSECSCHTDCSIEGSCCSDYDTVCFSCVDRCFHPYLNSKPCQCVYECVAAENCCEDFFKECNPSYSCDGRCGALHDGTADCQCYEGCSETDSCCPDYDTICNSCAGRCDEEYQESKPCQCNDGCLGQNNCCEDFETECSVSTTCGGRCGESYDITEECQCYDGCSDAGNCCPDYDTLCYSCADRCDEDYLDSKPCQCNGGCLDQDECCDDYVPECSPSSSCNGRCGALYNGTADCQCYEGCSGTDSCCPDYDTICNSCIGRCDEEYQESKPCQCNEECLSQYECCDDYLAECSSTGGMPPTDGEIIAFIEQLYTASLPDLVGSLIEYEKNPPGPLFLNVDPDAYASQTFIQFSSLRDNYNRYTFNSEMDEDEELNERTNFLDAVMGTEVMSLTESFMNQHSMLTKPLRETIEEIFFSYYPRYKDVLGSSGFENIFLGEISIDKIVGLNNWYSYYLDELNGQLEYKEYLGELKISDQLTIFNSGFDWEIYYQPMTTILIGSTLELELALYTVCFFYKPGGLCNVSMNDVPFQIQTYYFTYDNVTYVGSAYASFNGTN